MKKQRKISTWLLVLASAILGLLFLFPLWKISLSAPQYPEPLEMMIWINKINGSNEYTLQSINILNHYIGMAPIVPDSFPELGYMPWIVLSLIGSGLLAALSRRRPVLAIWVVLLVGLGTLGLWDFYHWEQQFGHNLNPHAPIKLEGMTYSPPFLGKKVLLNIKATSMPAMGAIVLFLSIALALLAAGIDYIRPVKGKVKYKAPQKSWKPATSLAGASVLLFFMIGLSSCTVKSQPINYGRESCEFCQMTISDNHYGTELVTKKGKVHKFDSVECLLHYMQQHNLKDDDVKFVLVTGFDQPGKFLDADKAFFLNSENLPSPMGASLTAFQSKMAASNVQSEKGGKILTWDVVKLSVD